MNVVRDCWPELLAFLIVLNRDRVLRRTQENCGVRTVKPREPARLKLRKAYLSPLARTCGNSLGTLSLFGDPLLQGCLIGRSWSLMAAKLRLSFPNTERAEDQVQNVLRCRLACKSIE